MSRVRNTSDPNKPAYDNPTGNKGRLTDLSHGGEPATGQNARDERRVKAHRSNRPLGHASDKKLGRKPPARDPSVGSG
jgi:hypothetical protein